LFDGTTIMSGDFRLSDNSESPIPEKRTTRQREAVVSALENDVPKLVITNREGGANVLGHPLGMSGARIARSATENLLRSSERYALSFMCVDVGRGIGIFLERA
jgi:acetyl-CoA acetyltransferase